MLTQEEMMLNSIERNIKDWLRKNPKLLSNVRLDHSLEYKSEVSRKFANFLKEAPRFRIYLKKIGILDEGLTEAGYVYLRRIAQGIS